MRERARERGKCNRKELINLSTYKPIYFKFAFTLAEVLITLGIIGVVAAITIPGLITKCRKNVIETQLKETYSIMNQALKLAEYDYEDMDGWDYPIGGADDGKSAYIWFEKYLQPYLKSSTVSASYHLWCVWYSGFAIEFINGTGLSCGVNAGGGESHKHFVCMFYPQAGTIKDVKEYSEKSKKLVSGKDYFVFEIQHESSTKKGFQPFPSDDCKPTTGMRYLPSVGCTKLIQKNNWKIPSNYPIKI